MLKYSLKRILIFIPTFLIISLLIFGLSKMAPGDPVELALKGGTQAGDQGLAANLIAAERAYADKAQELGLDKPAFYFNFTSAAYPDSLYRIKKTHHRELVSRLIDQYGNAADVLNYYQSIRQFELESANVSDSVDHQVKQNVRGTVQTLYLEYQDSSILFQLNYLKEELAKDPEFQRFSPLAAQIAANYNAIKTNATPNKLYIPSFNIYGFDNQYHHWISNFFVGDFGKSYRDNRLVSEHLWDALWWTLVMNFFSILIAYLISIPLGVRGAIWKKDSEKFFPFFSWAAIVSAVLLVVVIFLYKGAFLSHKVSLISAGLISLLFSLYAVFNKEGRDDDRSLIQKIIQFLIGTVVLSAASAATYYLYFGLGMIFGTGMQILSICLILTAEIILATRLLGGDRLTKIMTDSGDFFIAATSLWTLVALPWMVKGLISLIINHPIASMFLIALIGGTMLWNARKRSMVATAATEPRLVFSLTRWGIRARGTLVDSIATLVLFVLYSLPSFWIGTVFIVFITTPEYGMDWFPTGVGMIKDADKWPAFDRFLNTSYELVLPIFCATYSSFAYLSRQMRGSMLAVIRQDYIRTAKAKGLSEEQVVWKHAFRNSLFPLITLFSSIFPRALAGSIAIELIYNIPGMGKLVLESIVARDWPIVFTVVMFSALLTMIGNLIADMLYAAADPRISYN